MNYSLDATHLNLTETHPDVVDILKQVDTSRPIILHQNGKEFAALISIEEVEAEAYDALVIPGGRAPEYIRLNQKVLEITRHFFQANKPSLQSVTVC